MDFNFRIDIPAFVDSLQYMLMGLAGIFMVTGIIVVCMLLLSKLTAKKEK